MRCICGVAEASIAKATSMRSEVDSCIASSVAQAEATMPHAVSEMAEQMQGVVVHVAESTSCIIRVVTQRLELDVGAVTTGATPMSARNTKAHSR